MKEVKSIVKLFLIFLQKLPGLHTTTRELRTFEGSGLQSHHRNSTKRHPKRGRKNGKCGTGKKGEMLGGPEGESGEGVPRRGGRERSNLGTHPRKILNIHRTDTPQHNTTQHNTTTTTHNTTQRGFPHRARSMAEKTRHEQPIVPKTSPFLWCQNFAQIWAHELVQFCRGGQCSGPVVQEFPFCVCRCDQMMETHPIL